MNGTTEISIGGKIRPIKFGTNQSAKYCEIRSLSLAQMQKELSNIENSDGGNIRDLIYSALWAGCKTDKIEIDFDRYDLGDWIDEMEQDELNKCFQVLLGSNPKSEVKEGEAVDGKK